MLGLWLRRPLLNDDLLVLAGDAHCSSNLLLLLRDLDMLNDWPVQTSDRIQHLSVRRVLDLTHALRLLLLLLLLLLDDLLGFNGRSGLAIDRLWSLLLAHLQR